MSDTVEVHGESVTDGDSSSLAALTLYESGSETVYTMAEGEFLNITDVSIVIEDGGDTMLVAAAADTAGLRIVAGKFAANGGIDKHFKTPFTCPDGVTPTFKGAAANYNSCIIEGFITRI